MAAPIRPCAVGVTGHRTLPADAAFAARLERVVGEVITAMERGCGDIEVVSALAEGADRCVAELVLRRPRTSLAAVLPAQPAEYEADFETDASKAEFRSLLHRARRVTIVPPAESRRAGYEAAGHAMLAQIELLIGVWDGLPARGRGGTAEVIARAVAMDVPVVWLSTVAPYPMLRLDRFSGPEGPA